MKIKLMTLTALGVLALGHAGLAKDDEGGGHKHRGGRGHMSLERTTDKLNLTPEQKAQVQPIIDQAQPQIENIRREAMQKTKEVMDKTMAQIRPLLTPEQQKMLDDSQNDRKKHKGRRGHRDQDKPDNQ